MRATFTVESGPNEGFSLVLEQGARAVMGRSEEVAFQLLAQGVSRRHLFVEHRGEHVLLSDLGSHNGTWVNDAPVLSCHLRDGDRVRLGTVTLRVQLEQAEHSERERREPITLISHDQGELTELPPGSDIFATDAAEADAGSPESTDWNRGALRDLCRIGMALNLEHDLEGLFHTALDAVLRTLRPERAAVLLYDAETGAIDPAAARTRDGTRPQRLELSRSVLREVLERGIPAASDDARHDERFKHGESIVAQQIRSVACVPLRAGEQVLGALYADTSEPGRRFSSADLDLLAAIGAQAGVALERARLVEHLQALFLGAVRALVASIEARDPYTRGHSERVTAYALTVAEHLGLADKDREIVELAGLLHDTGKIGVPEAILNKPAALSEAEYRELQAHPEEGERIVRQVQHPCIAQVSLAVRHHHERWDGRGYPDGLLETETSLHARILAVADAWDAMTSDRPYRQAFTEERAAGILRDEAGHQLDPWAVQAFEEARHLGLIEQARELEGPAARGKYLRMPAEHARKLV